MELENRVEQFNAYDTLELSKEQSDKLELSMRDIFFSTSPRHRRNNLSPQQKSRDYISSEYKRIMPERVTEPLLAQRVRVFVPGYDHETHQGYKSDDHCIGLALLYKSSRPHFICESNLLRSKKRPRRYYSEFIPHRQELHVAEQCADNDQLFTYRLGPNPLETELMELNKLLEEIKSAKVKRNGFKEGMRGGMSFALPVFKSGIPLEPNKNEEYSPPWEHYLQPYKS